MKKILIISADPNSINSELIYKCWKSLDVKKRNKIYLISNYELLKKQFKVLNLRIFGNILKTIFFIKFEIK